MKYGKPEILTLATAAAAVQSTDKGLFSNLDNTTQPMTWSNPPAYEADE